MAKEYLEKLTCLVSELGIKEETNVSIEIKHFFSGAALYANEKICISWSPKGLAFKLSASEVDELIVSGKAKPLKYFDKGHVKKEYALFECQDCTEAGKWKKLFLKSVQQAS